jgi:uncharacterized protein (DUF58 family)
MTGRSEHRAEPVAPVTAKAAHLRRLELLVTRRLDGLLRGEFLTARAGPGDEPAGSRKYEPADDARRIDWNLTARSLDPQVRTTEADRELQTWVVVDRSASMCFGTAQREKSDVAFACVAAFGFLTARHGNRFGVVAAGGDEIVRLGTASTRRSLFALLSRLHDLPRPEGRPGTNADLPSTLVALERTRPRRGLVVVVSDFLDPGPWPKALARLARGHQVVAVHVTDPREMALPAAGMLSLVDTETGRVLHVRSSSASLRARYAAAARARHEEIAGRIRSAGAAHLALSTDRDWLLDVVAFVARRRVARRGAPEPGDRAGTRGTA